MLYRLGMYNRFALYSEGIVFPVGGKFPLKRVSSTWNGLRWKLFLISCCNDYQQDKQNKDNQKLFVVKQTTCK